MEFQEPARFNRWRTRKSALTVELQEGSSADKNDKTADSTLSHPIFRRLELFAADLEDENNRRRLEFFARWGRFPSNRSSTQDFLAQWARRRGSRAGVDEDIH